MQKRAAEGFSWNKSAREYVAVYENAMAKHKEKL
jgi:glycogen synthase